LIKLARRGPDQQVPAGLGSCLLYEKYTHHVPLCCRHSAVMVLCCSRLYEFCHRNYSSTKNVRGLHELDMTSARFLGCCDAIVLLVYAIVFVLTNRWHHRRVKYNRQLRV